MFPVTVADYISRAESQSRQNVPQENNTEAKVTPEALTQSSA